VPIAPTFNDNTDLTVAVNLGGHPVEKKDIIQNIKEDTSKSSRLRTKLDRFIDDLKRTSDSSDNSRGLYDVANQAFDAMQGTIARQKLAAYPPDIVIEIARNACGTLEFDRAAEMIELGRSKAQESLANASDRH
jgi:NTE family protein